MGKERRFRDFLNTETAFLDIARATSLTAVSLIPRAAGALVLGVDEPVILTDQLLITEGAGEADVTQAQAVQSPGRYSIVTGAHLAEQTAVLSTALAFSINQFSWKIELLKN